MPPIDIDEIMHLISYLERLPEVKTADVLPDTPNPIVRVFLSKSMALAAVLRTLPQIAQVNEVLDISGVDHQSGEKRERLQLTFGNNPNKNQLLEKGLMLSKTQQHRILIYENIYNYKRLTMLAHRSAKA